MQTVAKKIRRRRIQKKDRKQAKEKHRQFICTKKAYICVHRNMNFFASGERCSGICGSFSFIRTSKKKDGIAVYSENGGLPSAISIIVHPKDQISAGGPWPGCETRKYEK
jgi:hypothetical protein